MPTTYIAAIDEMFAAAKTVFDGPAAAIVGYTPDVRWPGAPLPTKPDKSRVWARVSVRTVLDEQVTLQNSFGMRLFESIGILFIQLFCPRNVGASIDKGRLVAQAMRTAFRHSSLDGEVWYRKAKIEELPETDESYPINVSVQFVYKTTEPGEIMSGSAFNEIPVLQSGSTYTLLHAPNPPVSLELFENGILLTQGTDYSINGASFTLFVPLGLGMLRAWYSY